MTNGNFNSDKNYRNDKYFNNCLNKINDNYNFTSKNEIDECLIMFSYYYKIDLM